MEDDEIRCDDADDDEGGIELFRCGRRTPQISEDTAAGSHDGQNISFGNKLDSGDDNVEKDDDDDDLPCARMQYATAARVIGSEIATEKGGLAQCKI